MKIKITQEDIDNGVAASCIRCPIARAVERTTGTQWRIMNYGAIHPVTGKTLDLPATALNFIEDFDQGFRWKPFSFEFPL